MSNTHRQSSPAQRHKHNQFSAKPFSFRLSPIAAVIAGLCLTGAAPLYAADDKAVTELQAEIARLKQALEKSQRELAAEKSAHAAAPTETTAKSNDAPAGSDKKETIAKFYPFYTIIGSCLAGNCDGIGTSISNDKILSTLEEGHGLLENITGEEDLVLR